MDFEACKEYTFDEKVKKALDLLHRKKYDSFHNSTGKTFSKTKNGIYIDKTKMPEDVAEFTFKMVELLNEKEKIFWSSMSEKQKTEYFHELYWSKVQKRPVKDRKILLSLLDIISREKNWNDFVVIKNDELVDIKGVDFEGCKFTSIVIKDRGAIIWKENVVSPKIFQYL